MVRPSSVLFEDYNFDRVYENGKLVGAVCQTCETVLRGTHKKRLQDHYKGCILPSDTPRGTASEDSTYTQRTTYEI